MRGSNVLRYGPSGAIALAAALIAACSGDGGGGGGDVTTFRGNVANETAFLLPGGPPPARRFALLEFLSPVAVAHAQVGGVEVCVEGTDFCTTTDGSGSFTLPADVSGTVTLVFTGGDFTARLTLANVLPGSTITLGDIECSLSTGVCAADDIDVDEPSDASEPSDPSYLEASDPSEPSPSADGDVSDVSEPSLEDTPGADGSDDVSGPDDEPSDVDV